MNHGQYRISAKLVEMIHQDFQGFHPGYRDVHASGRYYAGTFKATPEAKKLSRAVHLQGDPVPVTVRHSNSRSGNPWGPATTASMAVRFYLPDGTVTDLVSLPIPLFFARTPEETLEFLEAVRPDPNTGEPDPNTDRAVLGSTSMGCARGPTREKPAGISQPCPDSVPHASRLPLCERGG